MISPDILKKIKKIHIKSLRLVNSEMAGQYKSIFRGSGIEFEEVREYTIGDDVKNIDWKVSARLNKPFVKLYKEERESRVILLIDMSASSLFGSGKSLKIETAAEIGAMIAFSAVKNNDKVGAIFFTNKVEKYIAPKKGSAHIFKLIKEIFTFKPSEKGTNIEEAIKYLNKVTRKKSLVFLISDFLDEKYTLPLKIADRKHEIITILLSDKNDFNLPKSGIFLLKDIETGEKVFFNASNKDTKAMYKRRKTAEYLNIKDILKKIKIDCIEIPTDEPADIALIKYFKIREKRKR